MKITWGYLAGFTDGEGFIGICGRGPRFTQATEQEQKELARRIARSVMRLASPDSSVTLHESTVYHRVLRILNPSSAPSESVKEEEPTSLQPEDHTS